jgi:hypothetical protein
MASTKPCKLALIQLAVSADKEANLANARTHVLEAASKGANLIVLPVTLLPPFFSLSSSSPLSYKHIHIYTYADPFYSTLSFSWESRSASIRLMAPATSPNTPKPLRTALPPSHSPPWLKYAQLFIYNFLLSLHTPSMH